MGDMGTHLVGLGVGGELNVKQEQGGELGEVVQESDGELAEVDWELCGDLDVKDLEQDDGLGGAEQEGDGVQNESTELCQHLFHLWAQSCHQQQEEEEPAIDGDNPGY